MIEDIKLLLGITNSEKDSLLKLLIRQAVDDAIDMTGRTKDEIYTMTTLVCKMVVYNYNRLGTEGLVSEGFSGVNYHYTADYPADIMRMIDNAKLVKGKLKTY